MLNILSLLIAVSQRCTSHLNSPYLKSNQVNSKEANNWANLAVAYTVNGETEKAALAVAEVKKLNPNANLSTNAFAFKPMSASPQSYKDWYEKKYLPLYRKAGLPE